MRQNAVTSPPFHHFQCLPTLHGVVESFAILIGNVGVLKMDLNYIVSHTRQEVREQICIAAHRSVRGDRNRNRNGNNN